MRPVTSSVHSVHVCEHCAGCVGIIDGDNAAVSNLSVPHGAPLFFTAPTKSDLVFQTIPQWSPIALFVEQ